MKKRHLEKLFALLSVLTMQTVYMKLTNSALDILLCGALVLTVFALTVDNFKIRIRTTLRTSLGISVLLFLTVPVCHIAFSWKNQVNYSALLLIVVMCTVLYGTCVVYFSQGEATIKRFFDNLSDAVCAVTLISLTLYFIGQVFHIISPTNQVTIDWGGRRTTNSYFYLLFTPQAASGYHGFKSGRFTGIFAEAPMCSFMLCCALIIILYISDGKIDYRKLILLLVAIYATVSTAGYIIAIAAMGGYIVLQKPRSKLLKVVQLLVSAAAIILAVYLIFSLYAQKTIADVRSVSIRNNNFQSAMGYFLSSPFWGNGFKSDSTGVTGGDTSVVSQVLQNGGLLFAVWYFFPMFVVLFRRIRAKKWKYVIAQLLYMAMLYVTVVTYTCLSIEIVAIFFALAFAQRKTFGIKSEECK